MSWRCAPAAERRADPPGGTAPPATRWLLVEQPGPWGWDAVSQSRLDRAVGAALRERGHRECVRVLLIRAPGRSAPGPRRWAYADSRAGQVWWSTYAEPAELLGVPLDGTAGTPSSRPAYLVCTHGRHDPCCAIRGRPVAGALAAIRPEATWECSHLGGDRFAANVLVLPWGLSYGHVPVAGATALIAATEAGEVEPAWLRGQCGVPAAVQAAQAHARRILGVRAREALPPLAAEPGGPAEVRVRLGHGDRELAVTVAPAVGPQTGRLTCAADREVGVPAWRLVGID